MAMRIRPLAVGRPFRRGLDHAAGAGQHSEAVAKQRLVQVLKAWKVEGVIR